MREWWDDPEQYRKVQRKKHTVLISMPLEDMYCINFLEQPYWAKYFGFGVLDCADARNWYKELKPVDKDKVDRFLQAGIMYKAGGKTVTKTPIVVSGTAFESWCIDFKTLAKYYTLADGEPIPQDILIELQQGSRERVNYMRRVVAKTDIKDLCACHVPLNISGDVACETMQMPVNSKLLVPSYHGDGDFVVTSMDKNGKPDMSKRRVVVGKVFKNTFNNRGWEKYISK